MPKENWKSPFFKLAESIRLLFESDVRLYHHILLAPFHHPKEIQGAVNTLEGAYLGKAVVAVTATPTAGSLWHAHYFFGDSAGYKLLGKALDGIEDWILGIPKGLIPRFHISCSAPVSHSNVVRWACLVYYLAWELDRTYFQAMVEQQFHANVSTFELWSDDLTKDFFDPRPILIQQGNCTETLQALNRQIQVDGSNLRCPQIIGAYLLGEQICAEFVSASLVAIDVLTFVLDEMRAPDGSANSGISTPIKRRRRRRNIANDVIQLKTALKIKHDFRQYGEVALMPMTADEIAEMMGWYREPSGELATERVSRRMEDIFGLNPMEKYRALFQRDDQLTGLLTRLDDDTFQVDAETCDDPVE